ARTPPAPSARSSRKSIASLAAPRRRLWNFGAPRAKADERERRERDRVAAVGKEAAMNRLEKRPPAAAAEAQVQYLDGDIRVLRPGAFVRCAVTGAPIPLDELRYWSVDRQEAYSSPAASMKRECERRA